MSKVRADTLSALTFHHAFKDPLIVYLSHEKFLTFTALVSLQDTEDVL